MQLIISFSREPPILIVFVGFIGSGVDKGLSNLKNTVLAVIFEALIYIIPKRYKWMETITGLFYALIPTAYAFYLMNFVRGGVDKHYYFMTSIALMMIFFSKKAIIFYGVFLELLFIIQYIADKVPLLGENMVPYLYSILILMLQLGVVIVALVVMNDRVQSYIKLSKDKEDEASENLDRVKILLTNIKKSGKVLQDRSVELADKVKTTREASDNMETSINEMAEGISETTSNITEIVQEINVILPAMEKTKNCSNELEGLSQNTYERRATSVGEGCYDLS